MLAPMSMEFRKACLLIALCLLAQTYPAAEEEQQMCVAPEAPAIIDGRTAKKQQMLDMHKIIETYMTDNTAYRKCLQVELDKLANLKSPKAKQLQAYIEEAIADSLQMDSLIIDTFNTQVRIYKSAQEPE